MQRFLFLLTLLPFQLLAQNDSTFKTRLNLKTAPHTLFTWQPSVGIAAELPLPKSHRALQIEAGYIFGQKVRTERYNYLSNLKTTGVLLRIEHHRYILQSNFKQQFYLGPQVLVQYAQLSYTDTRNKKPQTIKDFRIGFFGKVGYKLNLNRFLMEIYTGFGYINNADRLFYSNIPVTTGFADSHYWALVGLMVGINM